MSTQEPEGEDLGDRFAQAAKPRGTMSIHSEGPEDTSMTEAFEENTEKLGRGENPLAQGDEEADAADQLLGEDEESKGHADAFSPGRTDQPD